MANESIKKISINLPQDVLEEIDLLREKNRLPRSSWILAAVRNELKRIRNEKSKSLMEMLKTES